jgi:hypothetical protein
MLHDFYCPDNGLFIATAMFNRCHPPMSKCGDASLLEEVVRLYGLGMWVEQSYKHVKHALGWSLLT